MAAAAVGRARAMFVPHYTNTPTTQDTCLRLASVVWEMGYLPQASPANMLSAGAGRQALRYGSCSVVGMAAPRISLFRFVRYTRAVYGGQRGIKEAGNSNTEPHSMS